MAEKQMLEPAEEELLPRVLIAAPASKLRETIGDILTRRKIKIESVENANDAIERIPKEPPITGVVTLPFYGQYVEVLRAAQEINAGFVLVTPSTLTRVNAASSGIDIENIFLNNEILLKNSETPAHCARLARSVMPKVVSI